VYAVGTQGSHLSDNWVLKYMVKYSDDGNNWKYYSQNPLTGNVDGSTVHHNLLSPPLLARYFQLNPLEWNQKNGTEQHDICLRAALFQCKDSSKSEQNSSASSMRRDLIITQVESYPSTTNGDTRNTIPKADPQISQEDPQYIESHPQKFKVMRDTIPQGVILHEQAIITSRAGVGGQKPAKILLTSYVRRKRLYPLREQLLGNKRIFKKLRKTAKCIIKKIWKKKCRT